MPLSVMAAEPLVRLGCFLGVFCIMAAWELLAPRRMQNIGRLRRWPGNLGVVVLNTLAVRLLFPLGGAGVAFVVQAKGWGICNVLPLPAWFAVPLAVILLDLTIYAQHTAFHAVPALWRLHRMHHADLEFDVTTGLRFHPGEIVLSMGIKFAAIAALGAPPLAVLAFEVILNASSMFNHGNVALPSAADRILRLFVVTPDMHRVHHSVDWQELNSNYGFNVPWWDRLFGTYRAEPAKGHVGMTLGVSRFADPRELRLDRMLTQPLRGGER